MRSALYTLTTMVSIILPAMGDEQIWRGTLVVGERNLGFEVTISEEKDNFTGRLSIPGEGAVDLTSVVLEPEHLRFAHTGAGIEYVGDRSEDGSVATGMLSQRGKQMPLTLRKLEPPRGALVEVWQGKLQIQAMELAMQVRVHEDNHEQTAFFDSLAEKKTYRARWSVTEDRVRLEVPFIELVFEGAPDTGGTRAAGRWRQPDRDLPFVLEKHAEADAETPVSTGSESNANGLGSSAVSEAPIPPEAYEMLAARVQAMVDEETIVGGELLVLEDRVVRFRRAFGWMDRESDRRMEIGAVYCVRSMTKPLIGMVVQMLIDTGALALDTPVHRILPAFETGMNENVTVAHLLTHTAGFPLTNISKPLSDYPDLVAVADEAASRGPSTSPGSRFVYSDTSSDILGAIVATLTGAPVEDFIQSRILDPLGMKDTLTLPAGDPTSRARIPSAYSGGTGAWVKHWSPSDKPLFPIFLTSQSLYTTTTDYARFLALWMDDGRVDGMSLLSEAAVRRALAPSRAMSHYPIDFGGLEIFYGHHWTVYRRPGQPTGARPHIFGHDGSDGTHAWAWPERDLMVLFFTQSRGSLAGVNLAKAAQKLLVERNLAEPEPAGRAVPADVAGLYWDETAVNAYYVLTPMGNRLSLERPGKFYAIFEPTTRPGRYRHETHPDRWFEIMRADDGDVTGMRTSFGGALEHNPRHVKGRDLPTIEHVTAMVGRAHRIDLLDRVGPIRLSGEFVIESRGTKGTLSMLIAGRTERREVVVGSEREVVLIHDRQVWFRSPITGVEELSGQHKAQNLVSRLSVLYGDWSREYDRVTILKRLTVRDRSLLLVRVEPREGFGATLFVDEASGRVVRTESLVQVPGLGILGVAVQFGDFREVGGMVLPFRSEARYAAKLLGRVVTTMTEAETGVALKGDVLERLDGSDTPRE